MAILGRGSNDTGSMSRGALRGAPGRSGFLAPAGAAVRAVAVVVVVGGKAPGRKPPGGGAGPIHPGPAP